MYERFTDAAREAMNDVNRQRDESDGRNLLTAASAGASSPFAETESTADLQNGKPQA